MGSDDLHTELQGFVEEIAVFIKYGIAEDEQSDAVSFLQKHKGNMPVLRILRDFYTQLPELRDEAVKEVRKIVSRRDCYLFQLTTRSYEYLFFFNGEESFFLGERKDGIEDNEVLGFFGYGNNEAFRKDLEAMQGEEVDGEVSLPPVFCPACSVKEGEYHELGCPVEICPWCDSQFTYCNCRFEKLGVEEIETDQELDRLEILLNDKGRIPFSADHSPAYPGAGDDEAEE